MFQLAACDNGAVFRIYVLRRLRRRLDLTTEGAVMSIGNKIKEEITGIEHRTDITDEEKVSHITHIACATCTGIAIQPIPFADIFVLTPIQAYFASRIAAIRRVPVSESDASDWIKEIIGVVGMGIIAQQIAIGIWKVVTFGLGGVLTIPLVYGLTYAVMKVSDAYFSAKARNEKLNEEQIKAIWKGAFRDGKKKGSAEDKTSNRRSKGKQWLLIEGFTIFAKTSIPPLSSRPFHL
jgi:uncharacterized protein (DUF697 family)